MAPEQLPEPGRRRNVAPADDDPVPVPPHVEGDHASAQGTHGADDARHLVDRVRHHEAPWATPSSDEAVALVEQPLRLADRAGRADEEVLDDQVETPSFTAQVLEGVAEHQVELQPFELEMLPGQPQDVGVALHTDDRGLGVEGPDCPGDAPAAEAEEQDPPPRTGPEENDRGGEGPPDDPCYPAAGPVQRREGAVHTQLEALAALPQLDANRRRCGQSSLQAAEPWISP
jgi:hypothetical protein